MTTLLPLLLAAWPSIQLEGFPHVQQKPDFCGEADVEMALRRLGRSVTQDDVFNVSGLDPLKGRGVHADELAAAMKALGLETGQVWYRIDPKKASAQIEAQWSALHRDLLAGNPSIVCMHYDASPDTTEHFRLVTGYDARTDEVVFEEPADGTQQRMKRGEFLSLMTFKPAKDRWTFIRLRVEPKGEAPKLPTMTSPTPAELVQHVMTLTKPEGFTMLWEAPFLVVGNEAPEKVKSRGRDVVRWTRDLLLKDFFARAPQHIEEVWVFKDAATYEQYSRSLFATAPTTPYGFYLSSRNAMVMNIKPGYGTLTHELVHPFMHENWPDGPAWLNEGLGSLFEQPAERDGHFIGNVNWRLPTVQTAIREKSVPKISVLINTTSDQFYDDDTGVHYAMARYLCYWLQERGQLVQFVQLAQQKKDATAALEQVLGGKPDAFQKEWEAFVMGLKRRGS